MNENFTGFLYKKIASFARPPLVILTATIGLMFEFLVELPFLVILLLVDRFKK